MWSRVATIAATLSTLAAADEYFSGDMTAYTLGQPSAGNCNFMSAAPEAAVNYAALNSPQWADTKNCGRCAEVSCSDSRCANPSKKEIVYILDRCPECKQGDLDVSPSVFKSLTGSDPARYTIKWRFVDCPVSGNIQYCLKSGSNAFWTAIQPANVVTGVTNMAINSKRTSMVASAYYYLLDGQSATQTDLSSVKVKLTSVSGETIEETVSLTAGSCTEGSRQFSRGTTPVSTPASTPSQTQAPAPTTPAPTQTSPAPTTNTPSPSPTSTPTPSPSETSPAPSASEAQSSNNSTSPDEADVIAQVQEDSSSSIEGEPGKVKAGDGSAVSSREAEDRTGITATQEAGLMDKASSPTGANPSPTTSDSEGAIDAGGAVEATTRSGETTSTSPAIIVLAVLGAVGMVALAVVAAVVKRKKLMDKDADRDDSMMIMNLRSFDNMASPAKAALATAESQRRTDFAVL